MSALLEDAVVRPRRTLAFSGVPDMDDPVLPGLMLRLALPAIAGLSITALHGVVNAAFIGLIGPRELAAVTVSIPVFALIAALGQGIGLGAAASVGRCLGAGDTRKAGVVATISLALAAAVGLACSAAVMVGTASILRLFGASADLLPEATSYAGLLGCGCVLLLLQIACDFIAIGEGNTLFSMWTLLSGFTLNIVLDPVLIFGCGLGVRGAALATIVSQVVALAAYAGYFARGWGVVRLGVDLGPSPGANLRSIIRIGLPTTLGGVLSAAAYGLVYRAAETYGGVDAVAGLGIAFRLTELGTLPLVGFCLGVQSVLSHGWGAGKRGRVLAASRLMLRLALAFTFSYAAVLSAAAGPLVALFTRDDAARQIGVHALVMLQVGFALSAFEFVLLVLLQAQGDARLAALVSLAPQGYLLLPLLALLPPSWGAAGISASCALATALTGLASAGMLLVQHANLRRDGEDAPTDPALPHCPFSQSLDVP